MNGKDNLSILNISLGFSVTSVLFNLITGSFLPLLISIFSAMFCIVALEVAKSSQNKGK